MLTGRGLSAESGIPTSRDAKDRLWSSIDPMAVASIDGFTRDSGKVWARHDDMRILFLGANPNPGHDGIALPDVAVLTGAAASGWSNRGESMR